MNLGVGLRHWSQTMTIVLQQLVSEMNFAKSWTFFLSQRSLRQGFQGFHWARSTSSELSPVLRSQNYSFIILLLPRIESLLPQFNKWINTKKKPIFRLEILSQAKRRSRTYVGTKTLRQALTRWPTSKEGNTFVVLVLTNILSYLWFLC